MLNFWRGCFREYNTKVISAVPAQMMEPSADTEANRCIVIGKSATRKRTFLKTGLYLIQR